MAQESFENLEEDVLEVGDGKRIHEGDQVGVKLRSGSVEYDWRLESFGNSKVIVAKEGPQGKMRELFLKDEFIKMQKELMGMAGQHGTEGEKKIMAERSGIDTTKPDWREQLERKIRAASGS